MKINFDIEQLREDCLRTAKIKFGETSTEANEVAELDDVSLVKKAKADGFDVMVYIDSVEYDTGEKMSAFEARCAAEQFFNQL